MTLATLTALMSKVGRKRPELVQDRNVALFIQACIDEAKEAGLGDDIRVIVQRSAGPPR